MIVRREQIAISHTPGVVLVGQCAMIWVRDESGGVDAWLMFLHPPCPKSLDQWAWGLWLFIGQYGAGFEWWACANVTNDQTVMI